MNKWIPDIGLSKIIVGNKQKEQISKQALQENKAHQIFRKTNISYPLIRTRTCFLVTLILRLLSTADGRSKSWHHPRNHTNKSHLKIVSYKQIDRNQVNLTYLF